MREATIPESELQRWFVKAVTDLRLGLQIDNQAELNKLIARLEASRPPFTERRRLSWLSNARRVCNELSEAKLIADNRSIAPQGYAQMRPDLVLCSSSADYMLVELKTSSGPERQAVQELLAYSAAIKMQAPYLGDIYYIVVAHDWDELLSFGVRSLIMDGKFVLPLQVSKQHPTQIGATWARVFQENGEVPVGFSLRIMLELFSAPPSPYYDPWSALSPARLCLSIHAPNPHWANKLFRHYLSYSHAVRRECQRLNQSGFVCLWSTRNSTGMYCVNVLLATVNQSWFHYREYNENAFDEPIEPDNTPPTKFLKVHHAQADRVVAAQLAKIRNEREPDVFDISACESERREHYPESILSYDVLERVLEKHPQLSHIRYDIELLHANRLDEYLSAGLHCLPDEEVMRFLCFPFGEWADMSISMNYTVDSFGKLVHLINHFERYKATTASQKM